MELRKRFAPSFFTDKIEEKNYVCYMDRNKLTAVCYVGKAVNPTFNYYFKTWDSLEKYVIDYLLMVDRRFKEKELRRLKMAELAKTFEVRNYFKLGDVVQNSWGYDQTNQEFYQVVGFKGRTKLVVRELAQDYEYREGYSSMSAHTTPVKDKFLDEKEVVLSCRAEDRDPFYSIANSESFYYFHKWDGRPQYVSWYA